MFAELRELLRSGAIRKHQLGAKYLLTLVSSYHHRQKKGTLFMEILETILHSFVNLAMLLFEYIGVGVITFAGLQGLVNYLRRSPDTRLTLAQGLAMGLEFKLGSEILRTVIVRSLSEIAIVGSIIALRAVLTVLIHWEIRNEKADEAAAADLIESAAASEQPTPAVPTVTTVVTADTGNHVQADTEPTSATTASSEDSAKK